MKITRSIKAISAVALMVGLATSLTLAKDQDPKHEGPRVCPPNSNAFGKSLTEWFGIYWRWNYGTASDPAQSQVDGVQLMPLPSGEYISGDGTPESPALYRGTLEITLRPGTPFVLPEYAWVRERYEGYPAVADDPPMSDEVALASGHPTLTIDGRTIITDANKAAFYVPATDFDPIVVYPATSSYGAVAAVSYQGVVFVSRPLPPGRHVIHLYESLIFAAGAYAGLPDGLGLIYDNTWIVTVLPEDLGNHGIAPPQSHPYGKTYAEWSAEQWKWLYSLPVDHHPLYDTADVGTGQPFEHVWFLGGTYTATPDANGNVIAVATRNVTIPAGTALFFPILASEASVLEGNGTTDAELRSFAQWLQDHGQGLSCTIDGREVGRVDDYRVQSPLFTIGPLPDNNVFAASGVPAPEGTTTPSVSDGVWVMLEPLSAGRHTIHYSGAAVFTLAQDGFDFIFSQDITYNVTVKPGHRSHGPRGDHD